MRFVSVATSNQGGDLTIGGTTAEVDAGCDRAVVSFTGITTAGPASSITGTPREGEGVPVENQAGVAIIGFFWRRCTAAFHGLLTPPSF